MNLIERATVVTTYPPSADYPDGRVHTDIWAVPPGGCHRMAHMGLRGILAFIDAPAGAVTRITVHEDRQPTSSVDPPHPPHLMNAAIKVLMEAFRHAGAIHETHPDVWADRMLTELRTAELWEKRER